jgi:uncharacterized protein (TIGR02145 family)
MKACPPGWHLPTYDEWDELFNFAGGKGVAGKHLKAASGWSGRNVNYIDSSNGLDTYGFAALPGGSGFSDRFNYVGDSGGWWGSVGGAYRDIEGSRVFIDVDDDEEYKLYFKSVRCIKD